LSTARRCLLNAAAKGDYDTQLRARQTTDEATGTVPPKPADERWARDFAADVKAASRFATRQAERMKIASLKLPAAYTALGNDIYTEGLFKDDFADLVGKIELAEGQLDQIKNSARSQGGLAKMVSRVQLDSAQRKFEALLAELGKAAYQEHGGVSGPREMLVTIDQLERRVNELDGELKSLEQSRSGRLIGPKWLAAGALGVALLILLVVSSGLVRNLLLLILLAGAGYVGYRYFTKK
jgi:hypothetical protein